MGIKFDLGEAQAQAATTKPGRRPWSPPLRYGKDRLGISQVYQESRTDRRRLNASERQQWRQDTRKTLRAGQESRARLLAAVPRPIKVKGN